MEEITAVPGALQEAWVQQLASEIGLPAVPPEACQFLLPTVEMELRQLIQLAKSYQIRSKQPRLTVAHINLALTCNKLEPIYGLHRSSHLKETLLSNSKAVGNGGDETAAAAQESVAEERNLQGVLIEDKVVSLVEIARQPLPKCPLVSEVRLHWLAIDGVQPRTADNPVVESTDPSVAPPSDLSREMQYLYSRIVKMILSSANTTTTAGPALGAQRVVTNSHTALVCECLQSDVGIQDLVPYFCRFIFAQTKRNTRDVGLLSALMHMTSALLENPKLNVIPCLHQLLPAVFTCVVGAAGGVSSADATPHRWQLREQASRIIAMICHKYGTVIPDLYTRVCKTYISAILPEGADVNAVSAQTLYGGIVGAQALGNTAVKALILPYLEELYARACASATSDEKTWEQSSGSVVRSALVNTVGSHLVHVLKSAEMRRGSFASKKRKLLSGDDAAKKRKVSSSNGLEAVAVNNSGAVEKCVEDKHTGSALDEISEQLVPFYCAASVEYDSCRLFL